MQEHQLAPHTGLRLGSFSAIFSNESGKCVAYNPAGSGLVFAASTDWQPVAINRGNRLPMPCTPCLTIVYSTGLMTAYVTCSWQVRMTGLDQWGNHIQETLPQATVAKHANTVDTGLFIFWMSRVFSVVTKVEIRCSNATMIFAVAAVSVGARFTWDDSKIVTQDVDFSVGGKDEEILIYNKNQGLGLPVPVNPSFNNDPFTYPDVWSVMVEPADSAVAESNYAVLKPFTGGAGGGGFIIGQYRGASDTINGQTISYANVAGDLHKLRINRSSTNTILAMDGTTGMTFFTGGTAAATTSQIKRYTVTAYGTVGSRVGGMTGNPTYPY